MLIVALAALAVANAGSVDLKVQDKKITIATTVQDVEDSFLEAVAAGGLKCTCVDKFKRCTDAWCNMNCGHPKRFCPKSYCRCIPSATPPPPPAPYNPDAPGSMCVKEKGTYNKTASDYVCCASTCGTCGGPKCGDRPGGSDNCCVNVITANAGNKTCDETTPPCIAKATTQAVEVAPPCHFTESDGSCKETSNRDSCEMDWEKQGTCTAAGFPVCCQTNLFEFWYKTGQKCSEVPGSQPSRPCHTTIAKEEPAAEGIYALYYGVCYYSTKEAKSEMCEQGIGCFGSQDKLVWGTGSCPSGTQKIDWDTSSHRACGKQCT